MPSDDNPPETDSLVSYLEAHYGERFDEKRRKALREAVGDRRESGEAVSEADLSNDDAPAFAFRAYRSDE